MAGIQDPLTDLPPPSRFDLEELSNFNFDVEGFPQKPPSPTPVISWDPSTASIHGLGKAPLRTPTLLIASSAAGCHLIRHLNPKVSIGCISTAGNDDTNDRTCCLYALDNGDGNHVVLVTVPKPVPEELSYALTKILLEAVVPDRLLMMAALQRENFRGKLSADDQVLFRLETDKQRLDMGGDKHRNLPYFPSGSVVSGLPAAVLTRCQIRAVKARLLIQWPDSGSSAPSNLNSALRKFPETKNIDFSPSLLVPFKGKSVSDLDIYF